MRTSEVCTTPEELEERKRWWLSQDGATAHQFGDVAKCEFGFVVSKGDQDVCDVVYRPFGVLEVMERIVPGAEALVDSYRVHSVHAGRFWRVSDPPRRLKGFACHCEASSGVSHAVYAPLALLRGLVEPPPGVDPAVAQEVLDWVRLRDDEDVLERILRAHRG